MTFLIILINYDYTLSIYLIYLYNILRMQQKYFFYIFIGFFLIIIFLKNSRFEKFSDFDFILLNKGTKCEQCCINYNEVMYVRKSAYLKELYVVVVRKIHRKFIYLFKLKHPSYIFLYNIIWMFLFEHLYTVYVPYFSLMIYVH